MAEEENKKNLQEKVKKFSENFIKGFKGSDDSISTIGDKLAEKLKTKFPNEEDLYNLSISQLLSSPLIQNIVMRNKSKNLKSFKDGGMVIKSKQKVAGKLAKRGYGKAMKGKK